MERHASLSVLLLAAVLAQDATAQTPLPVVNSSFEIGSPAVGGNPPTAGDIPSGWTVASGANPFWIGDSSLAGGDPGDGYLSNQFISANWPYGGYTSSASLIGGDANSASIYQDVDLTPHSAQISLGNTYLGVSYAYFDTESNDLGTISYDFLDAGNNVLGGGYAADTSQQGGWLFVENLGAAQIPTNAATLRISLGAERVGTGTQRNIAFDAIGASLQPPPPPPAPSGIVNGNLIQFDSEGAWTWYTDDRAIVNPNNGRVLVNSVGYSPTVGGGSPGNVDVVDFDPQTGRRVRTRLSNQVPGNPQIQNDDHNVGALLVLPDGRYLAMYANHGNNGGLGDEFSRWRRSINPGDSTSWTTEQLFNWFTNVPGANQTGNSEAANVSYHNLFYLSEENQVYNISRSYGRLSTNGASQNMPNIMRYDMDTNTVEWAGQLLESVAQGYSAYPKYASNGVDRIYFTTTETHPRNFNNSIYAGYIQNGQTFDMLGNLVDSNIFDNGTAAGGSGFVPDVTDFTLVQAADPLGAGHNRLWTVDTDLDADGQPMALYISRWNPDGSTSSGSTTNPIDHRLHFAHWNDQTQQWEAHEVARMGNRLYRLPNDMSEQDYTGNAAMVPGDPSTIYISTPYDPRDPSGGTFTTSYEIYKGVTVNGGASWTWSAITENSVVDNLRPIVPNPYGGDPAVIWFRGTYTTAHSIDATIVGIVDRSDEELGLVNYVDATTTNTTRSNGTPIGATGPNGNAGANDGQWHERTGFGNGGSVFASKESGTEDAPTLKTTITGVADGLYDIFAYFWSDDDEDWRILAGLESNNLIDFRRYGSQHAEADQFVSIDTVSANSNDLQLFRAYLGRTDVVGGAAIDVFIDDWSTSVGGAIRTWYDGVGYAAVLDVGIDGDFDGDGDVDGFDFLEWQRNPSVGNLADWEANYGFPGAQSGNVAVPEPTSLLLATALLTCLGRRRRLSAPTGQQ